MCLHIYKWEIQERSVTSYILHAHGSQPGSAALPVADFCNSYLDKWLKFRHRQQEPHHSYLRKNGQAVIFWCIAWSPACKRDRLSPLMLPHFTVPPFILLVPEELPLWLIRCHSGIIWGTRRDCPPSKPCMLIMMWSRRWHKQGKMITQLCVIYGHNSLKHSLKSSQTKKFAFVFLCKKRIMQCWIELFLLNILL